MTRIRTEVFMPIIVTRDEIIVVGEAILRYINWLTRTPASAAQHRTLLNCLTASEVDLCNC